MQKILLWLGTLVSFIGIAAIATSVVLSYLGLETSYNFGDPAKFQFILVPIWQIGLAVLALGAGALWAGRRLKKNSG